VFEVAVSTQPGHVRERHRLSREGFARLLSAQPAATVVMEACGSAHYCAARSGTDTRSC
jgi:hypothetical protein